MDRRNKSLSLRGAIILTVIFGTSVPILVLSVIEIRRASKEYSEGLQLELNQRVELLSLALREPIWQFVPEQAQSILEAAAIDEKIASIDVREPNDKTFASLTRNLPDDGMSISAVRPILRDAEIIGSVNVVMRTDKLVTVREAIGRRYAIAAFIILAASVAIIVAILNHRLAKPLRALATSASRISGGDLTAEMPRLAADELGELGHSLEELRANLHQLLSDLSEKNEALKSANSKLELQLELVTKANKAKSDFLATMSHELRTPLNAIIGFSEMMTSNIYGALGHSKYAEYASDIQASGKHLLSLINDILDLTKIERGHANLKPERTLLLDVAKSSIEQMQSLADRRGLNISLDVNPSIEPITTDVRALHQVLLNLISNAIKFSHPNGTINLRISRVATGGVRFSVIDRGVGIPKDMIGLIGTPFQKLGDPYRTNEGGIGLGLSISRSLVASMRGTMTIESGVNEGTTVSFELPPVLMSTEPSPEDRTNADLASRL